MASTVAKSSFFRLFVGPEGKIIVRQLPKDGTFSLSIRHTDNDQTIDQVLSKTLALFNLFFTPALFHPDSVGYTEAEVVGTRVVWVDIDPAANEKTGLATNGVIDRTELSARLSKLDHPPSAIVFSGHGYHLYWRVAELVPRGRIKTVLRLLIDRLRGIGIASDVVCVNPNRIMRVPGTINSKPGRPVVLSELVEFHPDRVYPVEQLVGRPVDLTDTPVELPTLEELVQLAGSSKPEVQISIRTVAEYCGAVREALETGGRDHNYNQWVACLSIAHRDPDPWAAAKAVSYAHPTYTDEQLAAKLRNGPKRWAYSCRAMELAWQSNPAVEKTPCSTCPARSLGLSPIEVASAGVSWDPFDFGQIATAVNNRHDNVCASPWIDLPTVVGKARYIVDVPNDRIVVEHVGARQNGKPNEQTIVAGDGARRKKDDTRLRLGITGTNVILARAYTKVRHTYRPSIEVVGGVERTCAEPHYELMTPQGDIEDLDPVDGVPPEVHFARMGMVPSTKGYFHDFRAIVAATAREKAAAELSYNYRAVVGARLFGQAGWYPAFDERGREIEGRIFAINQTIFRPNARPIIHVRSPGSPGGLAMESVYGGDLEAHRGAVRLVVERLLPELQLAVAASLGLIPAQLVAPGNRPAAIFISSARGGVGKSLMCAMVSGLWNKPIVLTSLTDAAIRRLLSRRNLQPFIIDEATSDIEETTSLGTVDNRGLRVLRVLKDVVNGTGHLMASKADNVSLHEQGNWIVQFITTANHSIRQLHESRIVRDPTIADRFLDLEISDAAIDRAQKWFHDTRRIGLHAINENYGYLGAELIQYAVDHQDELSKLDARELIDELPDPEAKLHLDNASGRFFTHLTLSVVLGLRLAREVLRTPMDDAAVLEILGHAIRQSRATMTADRRLAVLLSLLERCRIDGMRPVRVIDQATNGTIKQVYGGRVEAPPAVVQVIDSSQPGSPVVETRYDLAELRVEHTRPTLVQELIRIPAVHDLGVTWLDPYNKDMPQHRILAVRGRR